MLDNNHKIPRVVIPPGYVTIGQAAALLGLRRETFRMKIKGGKLPTAQLPGGKKEIVQRKALERFAKRYGYQLQTAGDSPDDQPETS